MRSARRIPPSKVRPGMVQARAKATPSKVLWLSFLTTTSQGRSLPEPGPVVRGFCFRTGGATVDMIASVPAGAGTLVTWRSDATSPTPVARSSSCCRASRPRRFRPTAPERRDERSPRQRRQMDAHMNTLPSIENDFPAWYADVVRRAGLDEHAAVRGMMVIKPYGYAIWELLQRQMDDRIKATGHENFYFPMLIPASVLANEADLVEGFAPEVAVVTEAGGAKLEEPLVVRPTSEASIWNTYAGWIHSHRDLPLLYNQWANVVRWELRPRLFLRTTEFLWQEGHTAHETAEQALAECLTILHQVYADCQQQVLAMPVLRGRKSARERFPGALETFTTEAMMRDRKALQAATSHYLGDEFARAYGVAYTGRDGTRHHPFAASWGASSRLVGGVVMSHGDGRGLKLPPAVAPHQVVIVPITPERSEVAEPAAAMAAELRD